MRTRDAAVVMALVAALCACTGDSEPTSSDPLTPIALECDEFADTSARINDAQAELYSGSGDGEAIDALVAELEALEEGAPDDVQESLRDMAEAFRDAEEILADPTPQNQARLARLAPELADDGQRISAYIASQCA